MAISDDEFNAICALLCEIPMEEYMRRMGLIEDALSGINNGQTLVMLAISVATAIDIMMKNHDASKDDLMGLNDALVRRYLDSLDVNHPTLN